MVLLHLTNVKVNWEKNRENVGVEEKREQWILNENRWLLWKRDYYRTTPLVIIYTFE